MEHKKLCLVTMNILGLALLMETTAYAAYPDFQEPMPMTEKHSNWYVGGQFGWGHQNLDSGSKTEPEQLSSGVVQNPLTANNVVRVKANRESDLAGRINLGYSFNQYFALELGGGLWSQSSYKWTARNSAGDFLGDGSGDETSTIVDLLAKVSYTFDNDVSIFAKGGGAYVWATTDYNFTLQQFAPIIRNHANTRTSGLEPELVIGTAYHFNENWSANLSYSYIWGRGSNPLDDDTIPDLQMASFGLQYNIV